MSAHAEGLAGVLDLQLGDQASAPHASCAAAVIPLENAYEIPTGDMSFAGPRNVRLRRFHAVRTPRPELLPFQRFETGAMSGTLSNGCPFQIWWSGNPNAREVGEIRILSTVPPLDPQYSYLRMAPDPPPSWTPAFEGYRHVMSSAMGARAYVGLWNRTDGRPGSLVATYDSRGSRVARVGTSDRTYDGIYYAFAIHQFFFTVVDVPDGPGPLYIAVFEQELPAGICCRRPGRRR